MIDHIGYVQIDTISVIARAHHHILWSRVHRYDPAWLSQFGGRASYLRALGPRCQLPAHARLPVFPDHESLLSGRDIFHATLPQSRP